MEVGLHVLEFQSEMIQKFSKFAYKWSALKELKSLQSVL